MASLHQIQRNMTKQQQEIDALIARQKQDRARLLEENRRNLEAIRKQYEAALKKHDQQTDAAYRKALDDMQFTQTAGTGKDRPDTAPGSGRDQEALAAAGRKQPR